MRKFFVCWAEITLFSRFFLAHMNIYLDASIIVALLFKEHPLYATTKELLQIALDTPQVEVRLSPLSINEAWYVLWKNRTRRFKRFSDFTAAFSVTLREFMSIYGVKFLNGLSGGDLLRIAFEGSSLYNLRPSDAFHYAHAVLTSSRIYTLDRHFLSTDLEVMLVA